MPSIEPVLPSDKVFEVDNSIKVHRKTMPYREDKDSPLGIQLAGEDKPTSVMSNKRGDRAKFITLKSQYAEKLLARIMDNMYKLQDDKVSQNKDEAVAKGALSVAAEAANKAAVSPSQATANDPPKESSSDEHGSEQDGEEEFTDDESVELDGQVRDGTKANAKSNDPQTSKRSSERRAFVTVIEDKLKRLSKIMDPKRKKGEVKITKRQIDTIWHIMKGFNDKGEYNKVLNEVLIDYAKIRLGFFLVPGDEMQAASSAVHLHYERRGKSFKNPSHGIWTLPVILMMNDQLTGYGLTPISFTDHTETTNPAQIAARKQNNTQHYYRTEEDSPGQDSSKNKSAWACAFVEKRPEVRKELARFLADQYDYLKEFKDVYDKVVDESNKVHLDKLPKSGEPSRGKRPRPMQLYWGGTSEEGQTTDGKRPRRN